jgi:PhnB protein
MRVDPYLFFNGRCEEAVAFYARALGARVALLTRFRDLPGIEPRPGAADQVAHADLRIGETTLLASDGGQGDGRGFSLTLTAASDAEAERLFAALGENGEVRLPIAPTAFASRFGMVEDRFGVLWTVVNQAPGH